MMKKYSDIQAFYAWLQERQDVLEANVEALQGNPYWKGRLQEAQKIYEVFIKEFELPF